MERAMSDKGPVPEIDFTLHTMEDGASVSTQERVCKGRTFKASKHVHGWIADPWCRCSSSCDATTHR